MTSSPAAAPDHVAAGRPAQFVGPFGPDDVGPPPVAARFGFFAGRRHAEEGDDSHDQRSPCYKSPHSRLIITCLISV